MLEEFKHYLIQKNYAQLTVRNYLKVITLWINFLHKKQSNVHQAAAWILPYIQERQKQVGKRTLNNDLSALRTFHKFLYERFQTPIPLEIQQLSPKFSKPLPKFFTIEQIQQILSAPNRAFSAGKISEFLWKRDRCILECLYGCGVRVHELTQLQWASIDEQKHWIRILGKGNKERIIPFGEIALHALQSFRASFPNTSPYVIISEHGKKLSGRSIQLILKHYLKLEGLPQNMSPHSCRHSYATHLLQNGADIRVVQELLGHKNLSTTQQYTHVNIAYLQSVYNHSHPQK